jgi:hypothetical protein
LTAKERRLKASDTYRTARRFSGWLAVLAFLVFPAFMQGATARGDTGEETREYVLKAGFLYNFAQFVDWPEEKSASPAHSGEFVICVAGVDPFGDILDKLAAKRRIKGSPVSIRRDAAAEAPRECHILFIGASESARLEPILRRAETAPVLTVGDTPGYAARGVGINLVIRDNKIRFEINRGSLEKHGLKASSEILDLAIRAEGRS